MTSPHRARMLTQGNGGTPGSSTVGPGWRGATRDGPGTLSSGTSAVAFRRTRIHPGRQKIALIPPSRAGPVLLHTDSTRTVCGPATPLNGREQTAYAPFMQVETPRNALSWNCALVGPLSRAAVGPVSGAEQNNDSARLNNSPLHEGNAS
jgi:hypothetical protein